jgi:NADH:ubiquinone oxidoreductase subunit
MHRRTDIPPTEDTYVPHDWEKPHLPNLTGTAAAYRPPGSILSPGRRPEVTGDYEPWTPG